MIVRTAFVALASLGLLACGTTTYDVTQPTTMTRNPHTHMEESVRDSIDKVVVVAHTDTAELGLFGTYAAPTPSPTLKGFEAAAWPISFTLQGIALYGSGPVVTQFLIPYIILPVMAVGAARQALLNEIQEFRDKLSEQLTRSAGEPVSNKVLAQDLYSTMRTVPGLDANVIDESAPLPEDTDAVLLVRLTEVVVEVIDHEADISTRAGAELRRVSDGRVLYRREYSYKDRDTLRNWIEDDAALWESYLHFARHYFSRRISADFFEKIELRHDLHPVPTDTVKRIDGDNWQGQAATVQPTLAWEYVRLGDDTYPASSVTFTEADTFYDLEIYNQQRPVYIARYLPDPVHEVDQPLPPCSELRWTVRPSFHTASGVKAGEWMRFYATVYLNAGFVGTEASRTPAFTRGFAVLKTPCEAT